MKSVPEAFKSRTGIVEKEKKEKREHEFAHEMSKESTEVPVHCACPLCPRRQGWGFCSPLETGHTQRVLGRAGQGRVGPFRSAALEDQKHHKDSDLAPLAFEEESHVQQ